MGNKVKINRKSIQRKMLQGLKSKETRSKIHARMGRAFQRKKKELIDSFEEHPVTQEIKGGPGASNISGTLIGGYGNLYTFIGFDTKDPTSEVTSALRSQIILHKNPMIRKTNRGQLYSYRISFPSVKDMKSVAPMPWEPGSWVQRIELGISGLGYYLYQMGVSKSRSGSAIQTKGKIRSDTYRRTSYLSAMLKTFQKGWKI